MLSTERNYFAYLSVAIRKHFVRKNKDLLQGVISPADCCQWVYGFYAIFNLRELFIFKVA